MVNTDGNSREMRKIMKKYGKCDEWNSNYFI